MDCWLARDKFGMLQLHHSKPIWNDKKEDWISGLKIGILSSLDFEFKDVTFENSPVKVEINFKNSKNMENKKINVAELLKDCPKGMELDCTAYEDVYFDCVDCLNIIYCYIQQEQYRTSITFNQFGGLSSNIKSKCVIFPKGKTTWEGFAVPSCKFKDGDVLVIGSGRVNECVAIFKSDREGNDSFNYHALISLHTTKKVFEKDDWADYINVRFATEEEKGELLKAIKENGYKWNSETKTLEELQLPKFKDGDIVCTTLNSIAIIKGVSNKNYCSTYCGIVCNDYFNIGVMVLPKRLATEEEKQRLFKAIKENGYNWNAETKILKRLTEPEFKVGDIIQDKAGYKVKITDINTEDRFYVCESLSYKFNGIGIGNLSFDVQDSWELVPNKFDITTLKPYESKVLVRNSPAGYWMPTFWGTYVPEDPQRHQNRMYLTTKGFTNYCIPFEGNEALMGTADDCDNFYKTWEE